ncbi:hypothetical protein B9G54_07170 [Alloscardovia macacae]|uniref:Uncharacterized protein n=1 Tax=Alloscardovia macacae TaxID=1160091 RepID=A0A1Y2SSR7_9BIFI|nr:hypothetical protein [Alloscardovia macacae]OTA25668.1 hypothetical protein B9G54_07170 [Alloscardovia macacae]OTA29617.1 hypothetical protein B9T39_03170 [Alloscardovia macacae]
MSVLENVPEDVVERARSAARELESLYPLTDAHHLDNDVHYGDNLQVRQTFEIARLLLGLGTPEEKSLTIADAEYVFEGAEDIPGRDQVLVDALLAANDAYEQAHELQDGFEAMTLVQVAACVAGEGAVSADLNALDDILDAVEGSEDDAENLATAVIVASQVSHAIADASADPVSVPALLILVVNEFLDYVASPRVLMKAEQLDVVANNGVEAELADILQTAAEHWTYHHDEILWDKDEAKRKAKEDDERKSREALAAKFAHIQDDPTKEEVEL